MDLRQVLALVTGAAADIGGTTARRLAAKGADTKAGRGGGDQPLSAIGPR
jgi:NAD(P)-dependent dehydrogenase (short-subunit alcohol dehydrogenase family)